MTLATARKLEGRNARSDGTATVGHDLLSLISTAMYVEPLTIYREYVQNAADSVDDARRLGLIAEGEPGLVEIDVDPATRTIRIRDYGAGISAGDFARRMRSIGSSVKRGTQARGFRGVGRLGGLAYAQRLVFRSRSRGGEAVMELAWDCRKLRTGLKQTTDDELARFVEAITDVQELDGDWPERFFEVELTGVVRQGDDRLVRPESVVDYLSQVAPVPFDPSFSLAEEIEAVLTPHLLGGRLAITVNGGDPITRPFRDETEAGDKGRISLREVTTFELPDLDGGGVGAVGWIAHHDYDGAIPQGALIKGLRARVGDIQIGGSSLLQEVFPEARFCSWTVGEVHVIDARIIPNGRRDDFEQNGHYANLLNHLAPVGRDVARRCRVSSAERQWRRNVQIQSASIDQQLDILEHGAQTKAAKGELSRSLHAAMSKLDKLIGPNNLLDEERREVRERLETQRVRLGAVGATSQPESPLDVLPPAKRKSYQEMVDLIYECSVNRVAAKSLIDRILDKLNEVG
ncbi:ATP-binding protein [uncultured Novosphingobium sp.]|uniref:ATP-binding protein n=1 Tax=uncultured Novosphingobium sp. TaxID=292277 RepID=UPI002586F99B|nr:ATP-binding protein [uncultured Novosphingobium sp.]